MWIKVNRDMPRRWWRSSTSDEEGAQTMARWQSRSAVGARPAGLDDVTVVRVACQNDHS